MAALPHDGRVVVVSPSGSLTLWVPDAASESGFRADGGLLVGRDDDVPPVSALTMLADGRLVAGCVDGSIRLWR